MPAWDDEQYLKFADERTRPARELLARVPLDQASDVVDLGCGPGNSTALLHARWPAARIAGVDNSEPMLRRARLDWPALEWIDADASTFRPDASPDLIFANALLQWLPDHDRLVPRLFDLLRPGGVLAIQVPYNFNEPSHRLMRDLSQGLEERLARERPPDPIAAPVVYYDLLAPRARHVDIWQTRYEHVMPDVAAIVDWVKGTGLRPYLEVRSEAERAPFLARYASALDKAYPPRTDGRRLFSFPRLFIVATRLTE